MAEHTRFIVRSGYVQPSESTWLAGIFIWDLMQDRYVYGGNSTGITRNDIFPLFPNIQGKKFFDKRDGFAARLTHIVCEQMNDEYLHYNLMINEVFKIEDVHHNNDI
jgi:hypothetical protein